MSKPVYQYAEDIIEEQLLAAEEGRCLLYETEEAAELRMRVEAAGYMVMPWHIFERIGVDPALLRRAVAAAHLADTPSRWVVFSASEPEEGQVLVGEDFESLCERALSN